jgi:hypothetical protein
VSDVYAQTVSDAANIARVRDGIFFRETGTESSQTKSDHGVLRPSTTEFATTTTEGVAHAFRCAMVQHHTDTRLSLSKVRQALAATSGDAIEMLKQNGSFLHHGERLVSKQMPAAPTLGTIYSTTRAGAYDSQRE